jgi:hypothetical protein
MDRPGLKCLASRFSMRVGLFSMALFGSVLPGLQPLDVSGKTIEAGEEGKPIHAVSAEGFLEV